MGDRGNIVIKFENGQDIYFYSHWGGSELKKTLQAALKRGRDRWNDESYLARIIFCEMVKSDVLGLTGYGISPYETDNEHPLIHVKCQTTQVIIDGMALSFDEYCKVNFPI